MPRSFHICTAWHALNLGDRRRWRRVETLCNIPFKKNEHWQTLAEPPSDANLRQIPPAAGIIEESESARGERGRVGQGRVGSRV